MPSNIIFFSQPLFPEGLKLIVESSYSSNQHFIPDTYTVLNSDECSTVEWQTNDSIIVVSDSIWTRYKVI